jgi:hypothetical protein
MHELELRDVEMNRLNSEYETRLRMKEVSKTHEE